MIENLDVMLWGKKVGTLVSNRENHQNKAFFYFDQAYVDGGYDIAPLRASIKGVAAQRGLPVYPEDERIFGGLPSFIADSLPDHWGNTVFNEWAKAHHIRMRDLSALDRLAYIGRRGMGALEFIPPYCRRDGNSVPCRDCRLIQTGSTGFKASRSISYRHIGQLDD